MSETTDPPLQPGSQGHTRRSRRKRRRRKRKPGSRLPKILGVVLIGAGLVLALAVQFGGESDTPAPPTTPGKAQIQKAGRNLIAAFVKPKNYRIDSFTVGPHPKENNWFIMGALKNPEQVTFFLPYFATIRWTCEDWDDTQCWRLESITIEGKEQEVARYFHLGVEPMLKTNVRVSGNTGEPHVPRAMTPVAPVAPVAPAGTVAERAQKPKLPVPAGTASTSGKRIVKRLARKKPSYGALALSYPEGGLAVPVPIRLIRGVHPVVRVSVNGGRNLDLLVDTGTNRTIVPPGLFGERNGQKIIHLEKLCFENGVCFEGAAVSPTPTNYSQGRNGYYNGLLGVDLLRYTGLTIDYRNRRLFLGNGDTEAGAKKAIRTSFTMDKKTQRPFAVLTIGAAVFPDILLDTGSSFTRLTPPMVSKLEEVPATAYLEMAFTSKGIDGTSILSLRDVCINGDACAPSVLGQEADWPAVGGTFFRNFLTTFDFKKKKLTLRPYGPSWTPRRSAMERLGLQLHILDARTVVWVEAGSPAAIAGITDDATLVKINGRPVRELGYLGAHDVLENPGRRSFDISFRGRDGSVRTVQVEARAP